MNYFDSILAFVLIEPHTLMGKTAFEVSAVEVLAIDWLLL